MGGGDFEELTFEDGCVADVFEADGDCGVGGLGKLGKERKEREEKERGGSVGCGYM